MGYAGNNQPQFVIPTAITNQTASTTKRGIEDLDYCIGDEALALQKSHGVSYPIKVNNKSNEWY